MSKGSGSSGGKHGVGGAAGRSAREGGGGEGPIKSPFAQHVEANGVSSMRVGEIVSVLQTLPKEAQQFIAHTPLVKIFMTKGKTESGTSGSYNKTTRSIALNAVRAGKSYGRKFKPGAAFSVSKCAKSQAGASKRTLVHEVGHHIHRTGGAKVDGIISKAWAKGRDSAITRYARVSKGEYFSESFAAYKYHRGALKAHDPAGYRMVRKVLREIGGK
jgi:hypothetical protein